MPVALQPNENKIDTWSMLYISPHGDEHTGKLTITNERLLFSISDVMSHDKLNFESVVAKYESEKDMEIDKIHITGVEVIKNLLSKNVILTLSDNSRHAFNYGALNIDRVVEAIESR